MLRLRQEKHEKIYWYWVDVAYEGEHVRGETQDLTHTAARDESEPDEPTKIKRKRKTKSSVLEEELPKSECNRRGRRASEPLLARARDLCKPARRVKTARALVTTSGCPTLQDVRVRGALVGLNLVGVLVADGHKSIKKPLPTQRNTVTQRRSLLSGLAALHGLHRCYEQTRDTGTHTRTAPPSARDVSASHTDTHVQKPPPTQRNTSTQRRSRLAGLGLRGLHRCHEQARDTETHTRTAPPCPWDATCRPRTQTHTNGDIYLHNAKQNAGGGTSMAPEPVSA